MYYHGTSKRKTIRNVTVQQLIKFDDYVFNPTKGTISLRDEQIHLEYQQAKLLALLIENHSTHVSREQISQEIWQGIIVEDNTISKAITRLRKVLNDNAKSPLYIKTVPKKGYQFIASFSYVTEENGEPESPNATENLPQKAHDKTVENNASNSVSAPKNNVKFKVLFAVPLILLLCYLFYLNSSHEAKQLSQPNAITYRQGLEHNAQLSNDTKQLIFVGDTEQGYGIYHQPISGSAKLIREVNSRLTLPKWFNSKRIIYSDISTNGECKIYMSAIQDALKAEQVSSCVSNRPVSLFVNKETKQVIWLDNSGAWQLDIETQKQTRLPFNTQDVSFAMPSPDNTMWASLSEVNEKSVISIFDSKTQALIYQTTLPYFINHFKWAFDSKALYHLSEHPARQLIKHTLDGDIQALMQTSVGTLTQISDVQSPNSIEVIISAIDLDIFQWQQGMETALINSPFPDYNPAKSPISEDLAFASKRTGSAQIWLKRQDNTFTKLTDFPRASYIFEISWSPTAEQLLVKRNKSIYIIALKTGEITELPLDAENNIQWQWLNEEQISYVDKSSNSLFSYQLNTNSLSLLKADVGYAQWLEGTWFISGADNQTLTQLTPDFTPIKTIDSSLNGRYWIINNKELFVFNEKVDSPDTLVKKEQDNSETLIFKRNTIIPTAVKTDDKGGFIYHKMSNNEANVYQLKLN